jgi:hypothetical protein
MGWKLTTDGRFAIGADRLTADVADAAGIARFVVDIAGPSWELAFHSQAPTAEVHLYAGTGIQGQITWGGVPQSASVHQRVEAPGRLAIRKVLDTPDVQGARDMSGFAFDVVAADGTARGRHVTLADGRTPPIEVPPGDHRIVEVDRPSWATGLGDGGPVTVRIEPAAGPDAVQEVTYTNTVGPATLTTFASDAADGDKYLAAGAPAVLDRLTYTGLVPGTPYVAHGELVGVEGACAGCPPVIARAETAFVPDTADGVVEMVFELPAEESLRGATVVALQRIAVAASGRVIAEHVDPTDPDQMVHFPTITTNLRRAGGEQAPEGWAAREVAAGDAIVDLVEWSGLAVGETYQVEMSLQRRRADGTCEPTGATTSVGLVPEAHAGSIAVPGLMVPGPGVFVAFQHVIAGDRVIAAHTDCDDEAQTLWVAEVTQQPPTTTPSTTAPTTTPAAPTPTTSTPPTTIAPPAVAAPPPPPASPPPGVSRPLPRTGGDGTLDGLALGGGLLLCGTGLALLARFPTRRRLSVGR